MPVKFDHDRFSLCAPEFMWPATEKDVVYGNPIERAGGLLVRELARVGWDVPGIDVEMRTYGAGQDVMRVVSRISGTTDKGPFDLKFGDAQGRRGRFNVCVGLHEATVPPGIEIRFYSDRSGPTAVLYTGRDWRRDGEAFIRSFKVNSKLNGQPKTYLKYKGSGGGGKLRHDEDLGREYLPSFREPSSLDTDKVVAGVLRTIDGIMRRLSDLPSAPGFDQIKKEGDANLRRLATVERIPAPADFPVLYAWAESNDAYRIAGRGPEGEPVYGLSGTGWRLCGLGVRDVPERAHDGFTYASADPAVQAGQVCYGVRENSSPAVVKLKWLNDVFVVDNGVYEPARAAMFEKIGLEGRDRLTDRELDECIGAVGRTMVPISEYKGGFAEPTYLIGRQTEADEVRLVKGEVKLAVLSPEETDTPYGLTKVTLHDAETGAAFEVFERDSAGERAVAAGRYCAESYARLHSNGRWRNAEPLPMPKAAMPAPEADAGSALGL